MAVSGFEIYRKFDTSSGTSSLILERTTVHISDDSGRIAMLEKRTIGTDDAKEVLTRYVYSNHLQSASLELDGIGDIISYEEYHPYGTTAFQAKNTSINAVAKRYRYTGKERDEESGLYYHGARYYIPWLARWTASDPMENEYAGLSPYNYANCNPITFNDPSGMSGEDTIQGLWVKHKTETGTGYQYISGAQNYEEAKNSSQAKGLDLTGDFYTSHDYTDTDDKRTYLFPDGTFSQRELTWYETIGFDSNGYVERGEISKGGFSDPMNYLRFFGNGAASIWNFGADMAHSAKNFSLGGLKEDFISLSLEYAAVLPTRNFFSWEATKKEAADIRTYENFVGILFTANMSRIANAAVSITTPQRLSFYTVQSAEDAARLRTTGTPWPSSPTRRHLGEGVYSWGSKSEANAYFEMSKSLGKENLEIVEFSISKRQFNKLNSLILEEGPIAEEFISKHSRLYGEGLPHNFDYIRGLTNVGNEHYFNKLIFKKLKFK